MIKKHVLTSDEKLTHWGYGEWIEEPDLIEFEHLKFLCKIKRCFYPETNGLLFGGHLCGYICIPEGHPWYRINFYYLEDIEIDVHGDLTYFENEEDGFWIGFDCSHATDLVPSAEFTRKHFIEKSIVYKELMERKKEFSSKFPNFPLFNPTYKNIEFVINECKSLAEQANKALIDIEEKQKN